MSATVLDSEQFPIFSKLELFNIYLISDPERNSQFCFPESLDVSRDEIMITNNDYPDLYFVRNNCSSKYTTNRYQIFSDIYLFVLFQEVTKKITIHYKSKNKIKQKITLNHQR